MAWTIGNDPAVYSIRQNARTFRRVFVGLLVIGGVTAGAMMLMPAQPESISIACDHAKRGCTFTFTKPIPLVDTAIAGTRVVEKASPHRWYLAIDTRDPDGKPHEFQACHTDDASAVAGVTAHRDELRAYLADPAHAPISIACTTTPSHPPAFVALMAAFGWLVIAFLFRYSSTDIDARFDRGAGRATIAGSRWFARRWSIDVPLSEVDRVEASSRFVSGQRWYFLRACLRDGRTALIWMPALGGGRKNIEARAAELTAWLAAPRAD